MKRELWDLYNEKGEKLNKIAIRGNEISSGEYHLVVHIWICDSNGRFLIQKRSSKKIVPNIWAVTGGSVLSGEDEIAGAVRETNEEIGIELNSDDLTEIYRIYSKDHITIVFITKNETGLSDLVLDDEEVAECKWVSKDELEEMIRLKTFYNYDKDYENYFESIFSSADDLVAK